MQDPENYESRKILSIQDAADFLPNLLERLNWDRNQKILDFGCGTGSICSKYFLPWAQKFQSKIFSVDISEKMLDYARKHYRHPQVEYFQANIMADNFRSLPPFQHQFDHILSIYVLHHIQNFSETLKKFYELLKPGGDAVMTVFSEPKLYMLYQTLKNSATWGVYMKKLVVPDWVLYGTKSAEACFRLALTNAGFQVVELKTQHRTCVFDSVEDIADFYLTVNPCTNEVPVDLMPAFRNEYIEEISKWMSKTSANALPENDSGSRVVLEYEMLTILAQNPFQ